MFGSKIRLKKAAIGMSLAAMLAVGAAVPALADNSVSGTINPGTLTASIAAGTLTAVDYSHSSQTTPGTLTLTVDDSTGSGAGWNVTVQANDFAYASGGNNGDPIPATALELDSIGTPVSTAGQARDETNGPNPVAASEGSDLGSALTVITAEANYGQGTYTQDLGLILTVPAQARAGTYTSTLTVTEAAGPAS